jgi:hypothetical protein
MNMDKGETFRTDDCRVTELQHFARAKNERKMEQ